jgi:glucose-6-phosphate 1-dehydrogenase
VDKFAMIIFGASGDLTKRKLMPALYSLYREKRLTGEFSILGIGRTIYSDDNYRSYILEELQQFVKSEEQDTALMASFVFHLYYLPMDPAKEKREFESFKLGIIRQLFNTGG